MQSSLKPKPADDPHDCVVIPPDAVRVAPSDAAPSDDEISNLLRSAARQHSDAQTGAQPDQESVVPPLDASFRPSAVNDDFAPRRGRVTRAIAAIVLAACIGGAAVAWQASGYAAKKLVGKWIPQFALTGSLTLDKLGLTATSAPPPGGPAEADATSAAPAPDAQPASGQATATQETATPAPAQAAESTASNTEPSDSAPLLQSMARDLANARKEVEALKTSVAELKASQQQMARELAKASEQTAHAKLTPPPARPAVANARKPAAAYAPPAYSPTPAASAPPYRSSPAYSTTQAAGPPPSPPTAQPYVPRQVEPLPPPQAEGVPRPPMPVQQP
jgi:hypothetical protein